jgi:hypothetical protein
MKITNVESLRKQLMELGNDDSFLSHRIEFFKHEIEYLEEEILENHKKARVIVSELQRLRENN